jgi:hypothetical protein
VLERADAEHAEELDLYVAQLLLLDHLVQDAMHLGNLLAPRRAVLRGHWFPLADSCWVGIEALPCETASTTQDYT